MHIRTLASLSLIVLLSPISSALAQPATPATHLIDVDGHKIAFHVTPGHGPSSSWTRAGG